MEDDYEVAALPDNPTLNHIRHHKERKTIKAKAKAYLYAAISPSVDPQFCPSTLAFILWVSHSPIVLI